VCDDRLQRNSEGPELFATAGHRNVALETENLKRDKRILLEVS